jgi:murein DD-endopeptidase MepM/ murein hydrolase activator NlpD
MTTRALKRYQRAHDLTADGIVGPATLRELGWRGRKRWGQRHIDRGDKGWDVAMLQFLLKRRGYSAGTPDGGFGQRTDTALHRFQRHCGLSADGVAGPITRRALSDGCSKGGGGGGPSGPVRFYRPVNAPITSGYGMRWGRMHYGLDFGAPTGTRVEAAGVGTVSFAGWNSGGFGYLVVIRHRLGYESWYGHLSRVTSHAGESVSGGTRIGYVGSTGHSTGPHLHFEVRRNGSPINPWPYLLSGTAKLALPDAELHAEPEDCAPPSGPGSDPRTARLVDCH